MIPCGYSCFPAAGGVDTEIALHPAIVIPKSWHLVMNVKDNSSSAGSANPWVRRIVSQPEWC